MTKEEIEAYDWPEIPERMVDNYILSELLNKTFPLNFTDSAINTLAHFFTSHVAEAYRLPNAIREHVAKPYKVPNTASNNLDIFKPLILERIKAINFEYAITGEKP